MSSTVFQKYSKSIFRGNPEIGTELTKTQEDEIEPEEWHKYSAVKPKSNCKESLQYLAQLPKKNPLETISPKANAA